jgi:hypothetical protein
MQTGLNMQPLSNLPRGPRLKLAPFLALALGVALLGGGCLPEGDVIRPSAAADDDSETERACGQLLGKAFDSAEERQWFDENCSQWPTVKVPQSPAQAPAQRQETADCARLRGRPYESDDQRNWYLANCGGVPGFGSFAEARTQSSQGQQQGQQPGGGPDRSNCDEIRGTSYRSNNERAWFLTNCQQTNANTPQQALQSQERLQQTSVGPDRGDCNAIRGTAYRSNTERAWYLTNCPQQPEVQQGNRNNGSNNSDAGGNSSSGNRGNTRNNDDDDD